MKTPYFYIIKHKDTGKKYVGSKWAKDADTSAFMTETGYQTSSTTVWKLIEKDGLNSFEIEDIVTEEELKIPFNDYQTVLAYESAYQHYYDCAKNPEFLNMMNNNLVNYSWPLLSESVKEKHKTIMNSSKIKAKIKDVLISKYGVEHYSKTEESRQRMSDFWKNNPNGNTPYALCDKEKHREIMLKPELWSRIRSTSLEKFGVEHYAKTDAAKEQYKKVCLERYGVDNYSKSQEFKYSISGENHPLKKPENRVKCSEAAKRPETIAKRLKTVSEQPLIICKTCGCVGKRQMINRYHNDNCGIKKPHNKKNIKVYDKSGNESYITLVQFKAQGDLKKNTDHFEFCSSMSPEGKRRKLLRGKL